MSLSVYTARISCRDPDCFNITRKSGHPSFAPSWDLLNIYLKKRRGNGAITWCSLPWRAYLKSSFSDFV